MEFESSATADGGAAVITVAGELDLSTVERLTQSIRIRPTLDEAVALPGASADGWDGQPSLPARSTGAPSRPAA